MQAAAPSAIALICVLTLMATAAAPACAARQIGAAPARAFAPAAPTTTTATATTPTDLPSDPTPAMLTWQGVERGEVAAVGAKARAAQVAKWRQRIAVLVGDRAHSPLADNGAIRDHEIADLERNIALMLWHERAIACEEAARSATLQPDCAADDLGFSDAIDAYQRVLAERPQHRRRDAVRIQLAVLQLRAARASNDIGMALSAIAALERLAVELPASTARLEVELWLAEDEAIQGRLDLAAARWQALMQLTPPHQLSGYAAFCLAWVRWHQAARDGSQDPGRALAMALMQRAVATAPQQRLRLHAASASRWMQHRLAADARRRAQIRAAIVAAAEDGSTPGAVDATEKTTEKTTEKAAPAQSSRGEDKHGEDKHGKGKDGKDERDKPSAADAKGANPKSGVSKDDKGRWPRSAPPR